MLVDSPIHQWHFADALGKLVCLESVLKTSSGFSPKTSSHQITEGEGK
jgi:hypothetical protein